MRRRSRISPSLCGLIVAVLAVAGCTDQPAETPAASVPDVPSSIVQGAIATPLENLQYPDAVQTKAINDAGASMIASCMRDRGFEMRDSLSLDGSLNPRDAQYLYGLVTMASAQTYGYRNPLSLEAAQDGGEAAANAELAVNPLPPGYETALRGDPNSHIEVKDPKGKVIARYDPQSCYGKAADMITPGWVEKIGIDDVVNGMVGTAYDTVRAGDELAEVGARWKTCMAEKGYAYDTPDDPWTSLWPVEGPSAGEIATAVADAECKESVGYLRVFSGQLALEEQKLVDKNPGILTQWKENREAAVEAARKAGF